MEFGSTMYLLTITVHDPEAISEGADGDEPGDENNSKANLEMKEKRVKESLSLMVRTKVWTRIWTLILQMARHMSQLGLLVVEELLEVGLLEIPPLVVLTTNKWKLG
jgi:hypothetical protein